MSLLVPIEAFDNFKTVKDFPISGFTTDVLPDLIQRVKELDEREEFEPWLRSILADGASTPHGPAEIVDIFTHHVTANGRHGMAAFILKGKSFSTVKPVDVAHQIYRLKKIEGLNLPSSLHLESSLTPRRNSFVQLARRLDATTRYLTPKTSCNYLSRMASFALVTLIEFPAGDVGTAVILRTSEFLTCFKKKHWKVCQ